jgi:mono/diheme cytochrome c family protein
VINRTIVLAILGASVALGGCSRSDEYAPAANVNGKAMFEAACASCHEATDGKYFELKAESATPAAIADKITNGGLVMPGFPNIKGEQLEELSKYVISVSKVD